MNRKFEIQISLNDDLIKELWASDEDIACEEALEKIIANIDHYIDIDPIEIEPEDWEIAEMRADNRRDYLLDR